MTASDTHYRDVLAPAESERRADLRDQQALYCPLPIEQTRPDLEDKQASRLRKLADWVSVFQTLLYARANGDGNWRDQFNDSDEIRELCKDLGGLMQPFIQKALEAAERHEALGNIGTRLSEPVTVINRS